jgi:hypothetical protein
MCLPVIIGVGHQPCEPVVHVALGFCGLHPGVWQLLRPQVKLQASVLLHLSENKTSILVNRMCQYLRQQNQYLSQQNQYLSQQDVPASCKQCMPCDLVTCMQLCVT